MKATRMKILRIKDNSKISKSEFSQVKNLTKKIVDKTFEQLEQDGIIVYPPVVKNFEGITKDQIILQSINNDCCSGNVMGFIGFGDERLVIKSRFDKSSNDYFLQYLLGKVMDIPNLVDLQTNVDRDERLFNLAAFMFPYYLKNAMASGLFKTYIRREYNDANVKGSIDVARHIKCNTPFTWKIAYNRREYSYDNYLTELVRHTVEFIRSKRYGNIVLSKVREEVKRIEEYTPAFAVGDRRKVILKNRENPVKHAYYYKYSALQRLCIMILQYEKHHIGSGTRQIYGILFDGAWLWEEYIASLVKDYFYHPMNKGSKGAQRLFGGNVGLIYPDFIGKNAAERIIADAKYKPIGNIGNRDYLQLLAYMFRFDAKKGFYFYPKTNDFEDIKLYLNKGSTYETVSPRGDIWVKKLGLKIPANVENYYAFSELMQKSEQEFINAFSNITGLAL